MRITYNNTHTYRRRGDVILQNWRKNAGRQPLRHAHYQRRPPPAQHQGGEVYNSEGQKESAVCCNSPPRLNVLHTGSNIRAISLSPPRSHVLLSGTQIRASHASYRKVRGRGVVLKPGQKNETVKRPRSKNKNFGGRKRHICEREVRPLYGAGAEAAAWC